MTFEQYAGQRLDWLFRLAAVLAGDRGQAEDIVQEVLIRLHRDWARIGSLPGRDAYVRRMVVNEYLSWRRKWGRVVPVESARLPQPVDPDFTDRYAERAGLVAQLARLPRQQRASIVLRFYEDLSYEEAASALGCGAATVRGHVARALKALRIALDEPDGQPALTTRPLAAKKEM